MNKSTALLLIDVQKGFDDPKWGKRNNLDAEENIEKILAVWRWNKLPIFHVKNDSIEKNSPLRPNQPGNAIKDIVAPIKGESVIVKIVNGAFIDTDLERRLWKKGIRSVVIVGLTTDHCVSTTARMAANFGFKTYVVSDATATFERHTSLGYFDAEQMHILALASLEREFATILATDKLV